MRLTAAATGAAMALMGTVSGTSLAADGKEVYKSACAGCHAVMAPKLGDRKDWQPLLKRGSDDLTAVVVKGKGAMPPKGGKAGLSNADVKAAVDYMIAQVK